MTPSPRTKPLKITIIGCGVSGISLSIKLFDQFSRDGYVYGRDWTLKIYERGDGPGGTWRYNTYPLCACDVPVHLYSLSSHPSPSWPSAFASQTDILRYWEDLYTRYSLSQYTSFHTTFLASSYSDKTQTHTITLSTSEKKWEEETDVLVSAIGGFSTPVEPKLGDFKGVKFHSTQWPKEPPFPTDYPEQGTDKVSWLKGKRVGVIGSGSTATQIVPALVGVDGIELHQFVRTPNYIAPRVVGLPFRMPFWLMGLGFPTNPDYSPFARFLFRWVPGVMSLYRAFIFFSMQISWFSFRRKGNARNVATGKLLKKYMAASMPKKYHDVLLPTYEVGCKRTVSDPPGTGYLAALWKENLHVHKMEKVQVVEDGIVGPDGETIKLDVLVYATGFSVADDGLTLPIGGRDRDLPAYWKSKGGPEAYVGILVPGFPNFLTLVGPNVISGNISIIAFMEAQLSYVMDILKTMVNPRKNIGSFEVKEEISDAFNKDIQARLSLSALNGSCASWYKTNGKITTAWPGLYAEWWWKTRKVRWNEIHITPSVSRTD
ncbi:FAD/NAD-binding domain-containing protein [Atractiella rhizophila]|nr:FAD/NAD-binding domain-containing protein [Atractiella rhizophila]